MIDPAENGFVVVPSDSSNLAHITRGLWVGFAGHVNVELTDNVTVVFRNIQAGTLLPLQVRKVLSTSTTASGIVGVY